MNKETSCILKITGNADGIQRLRKLYYRAIKDNPQDLPIEIHLPIESWLSADLLSTILILIQSIRIEKAKAEIYVELFQSDVVDKVLEGKINKINGALATKRIKEKIRFYDAMEFVPRLAEQGVIIYPPKTKYEKLKILLQAHKEELQHKVSSKMLSLRPLIDNQAEQHELSMRMETLSNILHLNLTGRVDVGTIKDFSGQIMFELVKNIYQHAGIEYSETVNSSGIACAQIYTNPQINNKSLPNELVYSILDFVKSGIKNRKFNFLGISINDCGVGLSKRVHDALLLKLQNDGNLTFDRFGAVKDIIHDEAKLIELAVTSDYSSRIKKIFNETQKEIESEDKWPLRNNQWMKLEPKGLGLIYSMGFLALAFGRMRIRSGSVELFIFTKSDAPLAEKDFWKSTSNTLEVLRNTFDKYFFCTVNRLTDEECVFPGTQILIEIPVETYIYKSNII